MIGSISKIRPCGHHHYYKYAHATEGRHPVHSNGKKYDMYQVSREYWNDVDENDCWNFSLENAIKLQSCCFELGRFTKFKSKTPKLTIAQQMFTGDNGRGSPPITEIEMDYHNLTDVNYLFYGMNLRDLPANFNPKTRNFIHLLTSTAYKIATAHGGIFPYYQVINEVINGTQMFIRNSIILDDNYTFENLTNGISMFYGNGYWDCLQNCPKNLSFKNATNLNGCFQMNYTNSDLSFTFFQTKDIMTNLVSANNMFLNRNKLSSLYPDYESFSLPKLSTATGMFGNCILDKLSIIKLSNALPDWSNDTATHNITIGCHIDHKYDPEVNLALKKLQSSYITPIEELGGSLSETVTSDKKWTITVQWNGTATENAYPAPVV